MLSDDVVRKDRGLAGTFYKDLLNSYKDIRLHREVGNTWLI